MNEIKIITELCLEDRARIDRLAAALEALQPTTFHVDDPLQKALAEQVAKSEKNPAQSPAEPAGAAKAETPATDHPAEESLPWGDPAPVEEPKPVVTRSEVQQAVIMRVRAGLKDSVTAIINDYAERVSGIPEDKLAECLERLNALEVGA